MNFIPLASPDLHEEDIMALNAVLKTGMLVQGPKVLAFEKDVASFLKIDSAMAVSNGTATLHLALKTLGIGAGDEVIVPAFSYVATANVVELVGAKPVFVDIEINTFNIDVTKIEAAITPKTKAIIPVHEFGLCCNIDAIMNIAAAHNLFVIEDAACALGAKQNNRYAGTFGNFGSFSFHPRKAISSGEGGLLVTSESMLANKVRILRNHGVEMIDGKMEFVEAGFNYRMTDFQAALVNSQFKRFESILAQKNKIASIYLDQLTNPNFMLPEVPSDRNHTWQTFHILLNDNLDRNAVISDLMKKNIGTNYGAQCIPVQKFYQKKYNLNCVDLFPNSMTAYQKGLAIPIYEKLTHENIAYIIEQLNKI